VPAAEGLPSGVVTFLFTDIVGSTRTWEAEPEAMSVAMIRHDEVIDLAVTQAGGSLVRPRGEGDSRFAVFTSPSDALAAAAHLSIVLQTEPWTTTHPIQVRVAVHTGQADQRAGDYYGDAVNRCARLHALAHPGQILTSASTVGSSSPTSPHDHHHSRLRPRTSR
jgi:class 3 adenylate cyclase